MSTVEEAIEAIYAMDREEADLEMHRLSRMRPAELVEHAKRQRRARAEATYRRMQEESK